MTGRKVTFLTGVSCAGKTTIGEALAKRDDLVVRDIDNDAPARPSIAHLNWLHWRAAEELYRLADSDCANDHVVVTGIVWPIRLVESPAWRPAIKAGLQVSFLMLDPRWRVLRERMRQREMGKALRAYNRELRPVLRSQVAALRHTWVFDPADLPVEAVASNVACWGNG